MKVAEDAVLLRIFMGESDKIKGKPVYEAIVKEARRLDMAGATVLKGVLGFGADSRMHSAKLLTISEDLPVIIEIVDREEKIAKLMPFIDEHVVEGLVTKETVHIIKYRHP